MADSFRSELNGSLWMVHWIIRLVRLEADHHYQIDQCVTSKYRKSYREQTTPYAFESLSRYFDVIHRSVCAELLQIQRAYGQTFRAPNGSHNSFKTCIKKIMAAVCCSEINSSALSLYFHWQNWTKQTTLCLNNTILTSYLLNCCISSVSHLHSCDIALSLLLVWYCLTLWCKYETQTGAFLPYILNFRDILTSFSRLHHAVYIYMY